MMVQQSPALVYDNVAGNYYDKYGAKNPIVRMLMNGFFGSFDELVAQTDAQEVFEVGCGEGHLSLRLARHGKRVQGVDLEASVVAQARAAAAAANLQASFAQGDIYALGDAAADLVVCCEVLEHVPDPDRALCELCARARRWLLLSVPREPIWRVMNMARGKYWSDLGNTPGHIQHWSGDGFTRFVSQRADILAVRRPLPWTMLLCRPRQGVQARWG